MSMLEGMAVGLVPFVQPNESFRELIADGKIGACVDFTVPDRAAKEIQRHMSGIARDDREQARNFALQFSWEQLAKDTVDIYRKYGSW
jgi:glycosyltransferase involved in cell wall biosynthesis